MKTRYFILTTAIVAVLGSLFTALAVNMFFSDIVNIQTGFKNSTFFASIPAISVALSLVAIMFFLIRALKNQNAFKRLNRHYMILLIVINAVGVIGALLAGFVTYGTFIGPNPFPGYLIAFMAINLVGIAIGVAALTLNKRVPEDISCTEPSRSNSS